jgi:ABC-2 type transport system ATP-binding protein
MEYDIQARSLGRTFGDKVAVADVDLDIAAGETFGFLGPNGAGKTTCVRMLITLLRPTSGSATVAGHDVQKESAKVRLRIGAALQATAIDPVQTGREYLDLQARLYGLNRSERNQRIEELAEMVDLGDALGDRIGTYSGGMARRIDLAGALVHQPEIVFLDEPTTGLDPASRIRVWDEIRRLNKEAGTTVFLTTQYLEEADELADRIAIIDQGTIVASGTPTELKRTIGTDVIIAQVDGDTQSARDALEGVAGVEGLEVRGDEVLLHTADGPATIGEVAVRLHQAAIPVRNLTLRQPTLDDCFLEITGNRFVSEEQEPAEEMASAGGKGGQ